MSHWSITVARRLGGLAATAIIGGFLTAALVRTSPGFDSDERQLDPRLNAASRAAIEAGRAESHSIVRFYASQVGKTLRGDFGVSRALNRPISELLAERLPVTAGLIATGVVGAWILALTLAVTSVMSRAPAFRRIAGAVSTCGLCLPSAAIAVLVYAAGGPVRATMALILFPRLFETLKNLLEGAYARPHIVMARAKGIGAAGILLRHVLPVCAPEFIALAGTSILMAFGACIPVETLCDLPGIGQLAWKAAIARDLPLLIALGLLITLFTQTCNAVCDWVTAGPDRPGI